MGGGWGQRAAAKVTCEQRDSGASSLGGPSATVCIIILNLSRRGGGPYPQGLGAPWTGDLGKQLVVHLGRFRKFRQAPCPLTPCPLGAPCLCACPGPKGPRDLSRPAPLIQGPAQVEQGPHPARPALGLSGVPMSPAPLTWAPCLPPQPLAVPADRARAEGHPRLTRQDGHSLSGSCPYARGPPWPESRQGQECVCDVPILCPGGHSPRHESASQPSGPQASPRSCSLLLPQRDGSWGARGRRRDPDQPDQPWGLPARKGAEPAVTAGSQAGSGTPAAPCSGCDPR
ncbi:unnamed protein product [Rangifer tarandus platyrhynchus]|uniref:Uncharacterized protein n=2 Tax=Rangifer tarandus platyrhynchus TaxID=3082113 RepID=A0ABN8ZIT8_RANTA|nr:unnamed protein product [Rangifer tarandus platyrhynchus]CAI9708691.1 unnamed protein product [Rangifer tarandus platyrhynchus]